MWKIKQKPSTLQFEGKHIFFYNFRENEMFIILEGKKIKCKNIHDRHRGKGESEELFAKQGVKCEIYSWEGKNLKLVVND